MAGALGWYSMALRGTEQLSETEESLGQLPTAWGRPSRSARFETRNNAVNVHKFEARATGQGVVLYVTVTEGNLPAAHRVEFVLGLLTARDDVASPLAALAIYNLRASLHHGDTVPASGPLWRGTSMRRFLVMDQRTPVVGPFATEDARTDVLQVIPLYESEVDLKAKLGADGMLQTMLDQRIGFWDPDRPPILLQTAGRLG